MNFFFRHVLTPIHIFCILLFSYIISYEWLDQIVKTGLDFPLGPDPTLWGKGAVQASLDSPQTIPPTFPILTSLFSFTDSLVQGAFRVNVFGIFLSLPPACSVGFHGPYVVLSWFCLLIQY